MTKEITSFRGEHSFLSNFYACEVVYDGVVYPSVEHAYQAAKFLDPDLREQVRACETAGQAKKLGRGFALREDWDAVKLQTMSALVEDKFLRDPELGAKLLATKRALLVEGNWWGDTFWGVCRGKGSNHLGKILMGVRQKLKGSKK